jgi:hypothetical protein
LLCNTQKAVIACDHHKMPALSKKFHKPADTSAPSDKKCAKHSLISFTLPTAVAGTVMMQNFRINWRGIRNLFGASTGATGWVSASERVRD